MLLKTTAFIVLALLASSSAQRNSAPGSSPQRASLPPPSAAEPYCRALANGVEHAEALQRYCTWALALDEKLPNILSEQKTARYVQVGSGRYREFDTVAASVSYEDGDTKYSDLRVNGVPIKGSIENLGGTWSTGEYGTDVETLFAVGQKPDFSFIKIDDKHYKGALIFQEKISRETNRSWYLESGSGEQYRRTMPGYLTRIWLDPSNGRLLHIEKETTEIDSHFPTRWVKKVTSYAETPLGDGTSLVLPVECITTSCDSENARHCTMNDLKFSAWRKFGVAHRIITGTDPK